MIDHPGLRNNNSPMTVAQALDFYFKHVESIIAIAVPVILGLAALITYRLFTATRDEELGITPGVGPDLTKLEEMLKAMLEKAGNVPTVAATAATGTEKSADAANLVEQINSLKTELEKKAAEMEALKTNTSAAGATASPGISDADKSALEAKLLELQKKLEEYDIIAQDIADLSFFKEENQRLQKELEGMKKAPGAAPAAPATPAAAPAAAPNAAPTPATEAPVAATPAPTPAATPAPTPAPAAAAPATPAAATPDVEENIPVDEEMKKFSAEVAQAAAPAAPAEAAPPAAASTTDVVTDSTLADWEAAVAEQKSAATPAPASVDASLDLDKMVAEAGALTTAPNAAIEVDAKALEQELDPEKLAAEADKLNAVAPEAKNEMNEFEKFINKGS